MDATINNMDKSLNKLRIYKETRFRAVSSHEKQCKLWVDRIGSGRQSKYKIEKLRLLGQFAAVAIEEGDGILVTASRGRCAVKANDVILIAPDDACAYTPLNSWLTRWIVWNGSEAEMIFKKLFQDVQTRVIHNGTPAVIKAFTLLTRVISLESFAGAIKRKSIILNLFYDLADLTACYQIYKKDMSVRKIAEISEIIRENVKEHYSVSDLAKKCNISLSHFRRLFTYYTSKSPIEFINTEKISKAKELLAKGMPIKQVAEETGFEDVFYFMRIFKKITGTTAGQFIKEHCIGI